MECMAFAAPLPLRTPTLHPTNPPNSKPRPHIRPRMTLPTPDPLTAVARFLWGRTLPPQPLVDVARSTWTATWHLMMSQLAPSSSSGSYTRPTSPFRSIPEPYWTSPSSRRNLHLYVGLPCPWAHRTLVVRALKSLESEVPVSIAAPGAGGLWEFRTGGRTAEGGDFDPGPDRASGRRTLKEVYGMRRGGYNGRSVVPLLWDAEMREVASNESYDIIEFLNSGFGEPEGGGGSGVDLAPPELKKRIEEWNEVIYPKVNNGVYRCGFAQSQEAYDTAANELFGTLDMLDAHLATSRYLCGDVLTLADVCLFTTLIRFDLVYNVLFKCTKKKLLEYPNLHGYTREIYQIPKIAATCNFEAIMDGYYRTLFPLNPGSIRPVVPSSCELEFLSRPHGRESLSSMENPAHVYVT